MSIKTFISNYLDSLKQERQKIEDCTYFVEELHLLNFV